MSNKEKGNLFAIIDSCRKIKEYTEHLSNAEEFYEDTRTFDAVLMNFVNIGEAVNRISEYLADQETETEWMKIKAFRNLIAHDYFGVDAEEVWQIIHNHLIKLEEEVQYILNQE